MSAKSLAALSRLVGEAPAVTIMSQDGRIKCTVVEIAPGSIRYALWCHAGAVNNRDAGPSVFWRRIGEAACDGLPWHEALNRIERKVWTMTHERAKPTKGLRPSLIL